MTKHVLKNNKKAVFTSPLFGFLRPTGAFL